MIWDSYERFFTWAKNVKKGKNTYKELFLKFGIENTMFIHPQKAHADFQNLSNSLNVNGITHSNNPIFIRTVATNGKKALYKALYTSIFYKNNQYEFTDNECNAAFLDHKKAINFKCSHVFERSRNPLAYTAKWNFAFTPQIFDPLTGHEAKGIESALFKILFQGVTYALHNTSINEYNIIMNSHCHAISKFCNNAIKTNKLKKRGKRYFEKNWKLITGVELEGCADALPQKPQGSIEDMFMLACKEHLHVSPKFDVLCISPPTKNLVHKSLNYREPNKNDASEKELWDWLNAHPDIVMVKFHDQ